MSLTEKQIAELTELLAKIPEGPYFAGFDDGGDCPNHANSGLAVVDTGRESDWPIARHCHWPVAKWIVLSRVALPALLGILAEKDAEIERLKQQLESAEEELAILEE